MGDGSQRREDEVKRSICWKYVLKLCFGKESSGCWYFKAVFTVFAVNV